MSSDKFLPAHARRACHLFVEPRQRSELDVEALCEGRQAWVDVTRWIGLAAHLDDECEIDDELVPLLARLPVEQWLSTSTLVEQIGNHALTALLELGILIGDHDAHEALRKRDESLRACHWSTPAAIAYARSRWREVDAPSWKRAQGLETTQDLVEQYGLPPSERYSRRADGAVQPLPAPVANDFDRLLLRRHTCRNFDADVAIDLNALSTLLHRVAGVTGSRKLAPGAVAVKKHSPGGGGLHATEAYLLVRKAQGLPTGLHHYLCFEHALEPLRTLTEREATDMALRMMAGQVWFAAAPVLLILTCRFERLYWKYRRHPKAWRVAHLDVGHLSQTAYLSAADLGLGAFVTAAINDHEVERALDLDPMREGAMAVFGIGQASGRRDYSELDPCPKSDAKF